MDFLTTAPLEVLLDIASDEGQPTFQRLYAACRAVQRDPRDEHGFHAKFLARGLKRRAWQLHNWPGPHLHLLRWYPFGNSLAADLLAGRPCRDAPYRVLCAASSDLRHVLCTLGGSGVAASPAATDGAGGDQPAVLTCEFLLNDIDVTVVARSVFFMMLLEGSRVNSEDEAEGLVIALWYNERLTAAQWISTRHALAACLRATDAPGAFEGQMRLAPVCAQRVRAEWTRWLAVQPERRVMWGAKAAASCMRQDCCGLQGGFNRCVRGYLDSHALPGCADGLVRDHVNPTMCHPERDIDPGSMPFRSWSAACRPGECLCAATMARLREGLQRVRQAVFLDKRASLLFHLGDALDFAAEARRQGIRFDVVHASNLGDYIGFWPVLSSCSKLLHGPDAALVVESFNWRVDFVLPPLSVQGESSNVPVDCNKIFLDDRGECVCDRALFFAPTFPQPDLTFDMLFHCIVLRQLLSKVRCVPGRDPASRRLAELQAAATWPAEAVRTVLRDFEALAAEVARLLCGITLAPPSVLPYRYKAADRAWSSGYERNVEWRPCFCFNAGCQAACGRRLLCARCKRAFYCSQQCQKAAWPLHKLLCTEEWGFSLPAQ